jgi:formate dehydrogenase alpha subunit
MSNSIAELEHAPLILAVGTNTTESHPVIALRLKKAVAKGSKLIVVDPRGIELTRFAHRWLRLRVGSDIALFNAMAQVIVKEELYDQDYVARRTKGFDEYQRFVKAYTPEFAEAITGVSGAEIRQAAREYAGAERAAIVYTLGVTEHSCGVHNVQSLANLALLCGNFGKENAGVNPLRGQNNVQGAGDAGCLPAYLPGYQRVGMQEARERWEKEWSVQLDPHPGITKLSALDQILAGEIRAVYIMGENTVVSDANASKSRQALEVVDFLVVQDLFLTETAQLADVVFPAACFAEMDGTFTNTERRVQRVRKAVEAPGQAKADWLILCELAESLGRPMHYSHPSEIWDEMARNTAILEGINYSRIETVGIQWPCPSPDHQGTKYLHKEEFVTDKGVFQPVPHVPVAEPPDDRYPLLLTTGRRRVHYHTGTQTGRAEGFDLLSPHEWVEISPEDAAALKLRDEDEVIVTSRRGSLRAPVKITERSPAGVIFMSFHHPDGALTNQLTTDAHDPITETAEYKACAVRVEKCRQR